MFPGLGGINPAQMQKMMAQLGIKTVEIPTERIVFYLKDGTALELNMPQVTKMTIQGVETYQVVGHAQPLVNSNKESKPKEVEITDEDIKIVIQQTNCSRENALKALKETKGDIAEAIIKLKK